MPPAVREPLSPYGTTAYRATAYCRSRYCPGCGGYARCACPPLGHDEDAGPAEAYAAGYADGLAGGPDERPSLWGLRAEAGWEVEPTAAGRFPEAYLAGYDEATGYDAAADRPAPATDRQAPAGDPAPAPVGDEPDLPF